MMIPSSHRPATAPSCALLIRCWKIEEMWWKETIAAAKRQGLCSDALEARLEQLQTCREQLEAAAAAVAGGDVPVQDPRTTPAGDS